MKHSVVAATSILVLFILGFSPIVSAADSMLRIACEDADARAEVRINGVFKGECPLDVVVSPGTIKLRVAKKVDATRERVFEDEFRIGDGTAKRVEVIFSDGSPASAQKSDNSDANCTTCPKMVAIPGRNYELGKYEVTQAEWEAVMLGNPSEDREPHLPVTHVTFAEIGDFLERLNRKTGSVYRLPKESEWMFACRGGNQATYCGGHDLDTVAWYEGNSGGHTHVVGQKKINGYGLHDMSGNVWEVLEDCWQGDCTKRLICGGSWYNTSRTGKFDGCTWKEAQARSRLSGFRLARTLK